MGQYSIVQCAVQAIDSQPIVFGRLVLQTTALRVGEQQDIEHSSGTAMVEQFDASQQKHNMETIILSLAWMTMTLQNITSSYKTSHQAAVHKKPEGLDS